MMVMKGRRRAIQSSSRSIGGSALPSEKTTRAGGRASNSRRSSCRNGTPCRPLYQRQGCLRGEYPEGRSHRSRPCACNSRSFGGSGETSVPLADPAKPCLMRSSAARAQSSSEPAQGSVEGVETNTILFGLRADIHSTLPDELLQSHVLTGNSSHDNPARRQRTCRNSFLLIHKTDKQIVPYKWPSQQSPT